MDTISVVSEHLEQCKDASPESLTSLEAAVDLFFKRHEDDPLTIDELSMATKLKQTVEQIHPELDKRFKPSFENYYESVTAYLIDVFHELNSGRYEAHDLDLYLKGTLPMVYQLVNLDEKNYDYILLNVGFTILAAKNETNLAKAQISSTDKVMVDEGLEHLDNAIGGFEYLVNRVDHWDIALGEDCFKAAIDAHKLYLEFCRDYAAVNPNYADAAVEVLSRVNWLESKRGLFLQH